jgi:tetratricopeptide (TPR) repeat protein
MDCLEQVQSDTGGVDGAEAELSGIRVAIDNGNLDLALIRTQEVERASTTRRELRREFAKLYFELDAFHDLHRVVEDLLAGGGVTDAETMCLASPTYLTAAAPGKARLASRSLIELMPNSATSYLLLAKAYRNAGETDRYGEALTQALSIDPAYPPLVVEGIRSVLAQGDAIRAPDLLARMDQGADYRLIKMDFQGGLALLRGEYSEAAEVYHAAFTADPGSTQALKLAYALAKAGEPEKSRETLAAWLQDSSHDDAALLALANKDLAAERYLEAAEGYSSVLLLQPNNVLALNNLAWTSVSLGEAGVAVQHAERAFQLAPKDARIVDTLGYTLMRKGDMSRARTLLERASALAPENLQIRLHLAEALIGHGQVDEAKKLLRSVLSQEGDPGAREQAAKLMNGVTP